jgi:hypothetical protein
VSGVGWTARASGVGWTARALGFAVFAALAATIVPACSLGEGSGSAVGSLNVPDCWSGCFDLHPDFFAAIPGVSPHYPTNSGVDALQIRVQSGGFYETFSDGLVILVDDAGQVRGDNEADGAGRPSLLGQALVVSLPPSVVPPGVPITPVPDPRIVHATVYLDRTCRTQNDALYALDAVSGVGADGECTQPGGGSSTPTCPGPATATDAGSPADGGPALTDAGPPSDAGTVLDATASDATAPDAATPDAATPDAGTCGAGGNAGAATHGPIGQSTITFTNLFDNNPDESDASKRLTEATFDFYFADPRETCPGGLGPPPPCRGHLAGHFKFYFQRGRPAQPFP